MRGPPWRPAELLMHMGRLGNWYRFGVSISTEQILIETIFMQHKTTAALLLAILTSMFTVTVNAKDPINSSFFGNIAIEGYDPVAYFQQNQAVEGSKKYQHKWQGAKWNFSSAANRDLFADNPEKYAPQYGGYCAYAVSQNTTAGIDPHQFTVLDGKLYLNYNANIQEKWQQNRDSFIKQANENWPKVLE